VIMAFLELVRGSSPGARYELDGDEAVLGRSADCEIPIETPAVSRRHAAVIRSGDDYFIEDLKSRNGTILNERQITDRTKLNDGDRLVICDQEFARASCSTRCGSSRSPAARSSSTTLRPVPAELA
jgi:pSer/pThr/pTyr-binding forkhead associated (FHA) protein